MSKIKQIFQKLEFNLSLLDFMAISTLVPLAFVLFHWLDPTYRPITFGPLVVGVLLICRIGLLRGVHLGSWFLKMRSEF